MRYIALVLALVLAVIVCFAAGGFAGLSWRWLLPAGFLGSLLAMAVALFWVHRGDAFAAKELALIFFVVFVLMFVMGAGAYALDNIIAKRLYENRLAIVDKSSAFRPEDYSSSEE